MIVNVNPFSPPFSGVHPHPTPSNLQALPASHSEAASRSSAQLSPNSFSSLFVTFSQCYNVPWFSLSSLKKHLPVFRGRTAPLGPSRYLAQVVHLPVGKRMEKSVSFVLPWGVPKFDINIFLCLLFPKFCFTYFPNKLRILSPLFFHTLKPLYYELSGFKLSFILKSLGYFELSVHRMIVILKWMVPVTILDGSLLRSFLICPTQTGFHVCILNILKKYLVMGKSIWTVDYGTLVWSAKESILNRMTVIRSFFKPLYNFL